MFTRFEGAKGDDAVLEIHRTSANVSFYIYYPGEESVGSRIGFERSEIRRIVDHLEHILDELQDEKCIGTTQRKK